MYNICSKQYFDFLFALTSKEIKARYKRAIFGFLWVILNPLLQMLVIGFIFSFFIQIPNYHLFLLSGLLTWGFFSLSLAKATPSIMYESSLLRKAPFPIEAIPLAIILSNFFHTVITFSMLVPYIIFFHHFSVVRLLFLVTGLAWILVLTAGLSLLTAAFQVKYRDIAFFVQSLLLLWFYATPIMYSLELVPAKIHWLFAINPLTAIFQLIQNSITGQGEISISIFTGNVIISFLFCSLGIYTFNKRKKYFVDWL